MKSSERSKPSFGDFADVYDDGILRVEHQNYYVSVRGEIVRLPRAEFLILSRLVKTPERFVPSAELWEHAWGHRKKFNSISLHVYMYRLRQRFAPIGVKIETMVNVGYSFHSASEHAA